jgi:hypothetical protein
MQSNNKFARSSNVDFKFGMDRTLDRTPLLHNFELDYLIPSEPIIVEPIIEPIIIEEPIIEPIIEEPIIEDPDQFINQIIVEEIPVQSVVDLISLFNSGII